MSTVTEAIEVDVPVRVAYRHWAQFEEFSESMMGTEEAPVLRIGSTNTDGPIVAGTVTFSSTGPTTTKVTLDLDFEPEGVVEDGGARFGLIGQQARADLLSFRDFVTTRGRAASVGRGGVPGGMIQ